MKYLTISKVIKPFPSLGLGYCGHFQLHQSVTCSKGHFSLWARAVTMTLRVIETHSKVVPWKFKIEF